MNPGLGKLRIREFKHNRIHWMMDARSHASDMAMRRPLFERVKREGPQLREAFCPPEKPASKAYTGRRYAGSTPNLPIKIIPTKIP